MMTRRGALIAVAAAGTSLPAVGVASPSVVEDPVPALYQAWQEAIAVAEAASLRRVDAQDAIGPILPRVTLGHMITRQEGVERFPVHAYTDQGIEESFGSMKHLPAVASRIAHLKAELAAEEVRHAEARREAGLDRLESIENAAFEHADAIADLIAATPAATPAGAAAKLRLALATAGGTDLGEEAWLFEPVLRDLEAMGSLSA